MLKVAGRITFVCRSFPPALGGGETLIYLLAKYLSRLGWHVSIVTDLKNKQNVNYKFLNDLISFNYIEGFEAFSQGEIGYKYFLDEIYKIIDSTKPHIVHSFNFYPGFIGSLYANINNKPHVFTYFNTPLPDGRIIKMFDNIELESSLVKYLIVGMKIDELIAYSEFTYKHAIKLLGDKRKVSWCYPGVDSELFSRERKNTLLKKELGLSEKELLIVVPARVVPRKKIETIIYAVDMIKDLPFKVVISSGGIIQPEYAKYYQKIRKLVQDLNLSHKVLFPDEEIRLEDIGKLYATADIGILTSEIEGLGLGILELMQSGVPVIATDTEGVKEILVDKKTGILIPVGDYNQLASNLKYLINNPNLRKVIGTNAMREVKKKFDLKKYIMHHHSTYLKLIFKKRHEQKKTLEIDIYKKSIL